MVTLSATVKIPTLPLNPSLGFPQTVRIIIAKVTYDITVRFNHQVDGGLIFTMVRVQDGLTMKRVLIPPKGVVRIRDPITYVDLMNVYGKNVTEEKLTLWLLHPQLLPPLVS